MQQVIGSSELRPDFFMDVIWWGMGRVIGINHQTTVSQESLQFIRLLKATEGVQGVLRR